MVLGIIIFQNVVFALFREKVSFSKELYSENKMSWDIRLFRQDLVFSPALTFSKISAACRNSGPWWAEFSRKFINHMLPCVFDSTVLDFVAKIVSRYPWAFCRPSHFASPLVAPLAELTFHLANLSGVSRCFVP